MKPETEEIEVEVVEVVDAPLSTERTSSAGEPHARGIPPEGGGGWQSQWQGRVRQIHMRWWPLWAVIALIALIPLVLIALVIGICLVVLKLLGRVISALKK